MLFSSPAFSEEEGEPEESGKGNKEEAWELELDVEEERPKEEADEVEKAEDADDGALGGLEKRAATHLRALFANNEVVCDYQRGWHRTHNV